MVVEGGSSVERVDLPPTGLDKSPAPLPAAMTEPFMSRLYMENTGSFASRRACEGGGRGGVVAPLEHKAVLGSARGCAEGLFAGPWGGLTPGRI